MDISHNALTSLPSEIFSSYEYIPYNTMIEEICPEKTGEGNMRVQDAAHAVIYPHAFNL